MFKMESYRQNGMNLIDVHGLYEGKGYSVFTDYEVSHEKESY